MAINSSIVDDFIYDTKAWVDAKEAMELCGLVVGNSERGSYGEKIRTLKIKLDKIPILEEKVADLESKVSTDDVYFLDIYNAILLKEQEPVFEDRSTYAPAIMAIKSGADIPVMDYFFYKNKRKVDDYWGIVNSNVISMSHMLDSAEFTAGNEYLLDVTGCVDVGSLESVFCNTWANVGGTATVKLKVGAGNTTLADFSKGSSRSGNNYSRFITVLFTDDSIGDNISSLNNFLCGLSLGKVDLSKLSGAVIVSMNSVFNGSILNELIVPLNTSECTDFYKCFAGVDGNAYGTLKNIDLSTWTFKEGANMNFMFDNLNVNGVTFNNAVIKNSNTNGMFNYAKALKGTLNLSIQDTLNTLGNNFHNETFRVCENLVGIEGEPFVLRSNSERMFQSCSKLESLPPVTFHVIGGYKDSLNSAFSNCSKLKSLNISIIYAGTQNLNITEGFKGCSVLEHIYGNLDLSRANSIGSMFSGCSSLIDIETSGSLGGLINSNQTFDFSSSPVFNISKLINDLASNNSGYTKTIKLHSTVYGALSDDTKALAVEKGYTLAS